MRPFIVQYFAVHTMCNYELQRLHQIKITEVQALYILTWYSCPTKNSQELSKNFSPKLSVYYFNTLFFRILENVFRFPRILVCKTLVIHISQECESECEIFFWQFLSCNVRNAHML